nr:RNA-directed DNA polymerase, eukaryota [Tanacetum cinerariifolium]
MLFDFATSSARGKWLASGLDLLFMSIYSTQDMPRKIQLWAYMTEIINRWHGEVVVMGDFNEVRFASKRHGSTFYASYAVEFNMFITNSHLIDVPLGGYSFTWEHDRGVLQDYILENDSCLDKREGLPDDLLNHAKTFHDIGIIDCEKPVDMAQKAKVKWAVKGDENYKFFHGIVNKKRRQQAIKSILVDGE